MDPTSRGDRMADLLRRYYERNRESWWDRHRPQIFSHRDNGGIVADEWAIGLMNEAYRIANLSDRDLYNECR